MNKPSKRLSLIVFAIILTFSLAGCSVYQRHPNSDARINAQLENQIRKDFAEEFSYNFEDVYVHQYFGTFSDSSVIRMRVYDWDSLEPLFPLIIAGVDFGYVSHPLFMVWNNRKFYDLQIAYELKLLTLSDIETIVYRHRNSNWQKT
ncbi:MAG: hypothetical protein FWC80_01755 [Firmicutes bacterium]|nr:hypothetical protein [Bacillota bacterium]